MLAFEYNDIYVPLPKSKTTKVPVITHVGIQAAEVGRRLIRKVDGVWTLLPL